MKISIIMHEILQHGRGSGRSTHSSDKYFSKNVLLNLLGSLTPSGKQKEPERPFPMMPAQNMTPQSLCWHGMRCQLCIQICPIKQVLIISMFFKIGSWQCSFWFSWSYDIIFCNLWIRKNNIYDFDALSSGPQPHLNSSSKPRKREIMKKGHNFDLWE